MEQQLTIEMIADAFSYDITGLLWSNLNGHFDRVFSPRQGT
ncbi:hypothetical protein [Klebsiella pneumoniae]